MFDARLAACLRLVFSCIPWALIHLLTAWINNNWYDLFWPEFRECGLGVEKQRVYPMISETMAAYVKHMQTDGIRSQLIGNNSL